MQKIKYNGAIIILAARIPLLFENISSLYKNWNNKFKYPLYIHTFGSLISEKLKNEIKNKIDNNIKFIEINPIIPSHIKEEEFYYNRNYHDYVKKAFPKKD